MLFRSTRGAFLDMTFEEAVFEGLASDGGLLIPHFVPDVKNKYKQVSSTSLLYPSPVLLSCIPPPYPYVQERAWEKE